MRDHLELADYQSYFEPITAKSEAEEVGKCWPRKTHFVLGGSVNIEVLGLLHSFFLGFGTSCLKLHPRSRYCSRLETQPCSTSPFHVIPSHNDIEHLPYTGERDAPFKNFESVQYT